MLLTVSKATVPSASAPNQLPGVLLTVTGLSHRLKQMTHFRVSSSRSFFLPPSPAAFLAASFFLPPSAPAAHGGEGEGESSCAQLQLRHPCDAGCWW
jgi:hypothetical protein